MPPVSVSAYYAIKQTSFADVGLSYSLYHKKQKEKFDN